MWRPKLWQSPAQVWKRKKQHFAMVRIILFCQKAILPGFWTPRKNIWLVISNINTKQLYCIHVTWNVTHISLFLKQISCSPSKFFEIFQIFINFLQFKFGGDNISYQNILLIYCLLWNYFLFPLVWSGAKKYKYTYSLV